MKKLKFVLAATAALLLMAVVFQYGCKKAQLQQTNSDYEQLIAAQDYSNNELVRLIKLTDPPLSDRELMGYMIAASPLNDNIIKELLKRGQPPCRCALSDETLQMILLFNLPLSAHILKELEKHDIKLSRSLLENINLDDLPDMELDKANLLMESLLNLKFGDGLSLFHKVERVTTTFQVQGILQSGEYFVLGQEFIDIIDQMRLQCPTDEGIITTPCVSKHILAVDLEIITSIDPITGNKVFDVNLTTIVALELPMPAGPKCAFIEAEAFKAYGATLCLDAVAGTGGTCTGQFPNTDAAEQIETIVNANFCGKLEGSCEFFTNVQTFTVEGGQVAVENPTDPQIEDNIYDYLLFHSSTGWPFGSGNHHDCVDGNYWGYAGPFPSYETNELKFYLEGTLQAADTVNPWPLTHEPFAIDLVGCKDLSTFPITKLFHKLETSYAQVCVLPVIDL